MPTCPAPPPLQMAYQVVEKRRDPGHFGVAAGGAAEQVRRGAGRSSGRLQAITAGVGGTRSPRGSPEGARQRTPQGLWLVARRELQDFEGDVA